MKKIAALLVQVAKQTRKTKTGVKAGAAEAC